MSLAVRPLGRVTAAVGETYYGYTCCTTGGDGEACGDVGKKDDYRGAVVLIILALAIVIGAALTTILCCCIPGCSGHKCRKGSKPIQQTAPPAQIPMAQAQAMPMAVAQGMPVAAATPQKNKYQAST